RDLLAYHGAEALAQPMDGDAGRGLGRAQLAGQLLVASVRLTPNEEGLQLLEAGEAVGLVVLLPQAAQALREHRRRPLPLEDGLGSQPVDGLAAPALLGLVDVEREHGLAPSALLCPLAIPLVRQEVGHGRTEERAEAPDLRTEVVEVPLLEE